MCSFSIILTTLHPFNLSLIYCYTYVSTLILCIATLIFLIFRNSTQVPRMLTLISLYTNSFLRIPSFHFLITHFDFYRQPVLFVMFKSQFQGNRYLSSKVNFSLCYYCIGISTKLLFTSSMTSSPMSTKNIYLTVPQVKNP